MEGGSCGKDGVVVVVHGQHVYSCGGEWCSLSYVSVGDRDVVECILQKAMLAKMDAKSVIFVCE